MTEIRRKIILDYARWTALSALRRGPIRKGLDVYPLLDKVAFDDVLRASEPIALAEFDAWHEAETMALCARNACVPIGWGVKLINVYLKTAAYVGDLGRPGLRGVLHPPIDTGLWKGFGRQFRGRTQILTDICCVRRIKDITEYPTYQRIIKGCRAAAIELRCSLFEVEQLSGIGHSAV